MSKGSGTTLTLEEVEKRIKKKHGGKIKMFPESFINVNEHADFSCSVCDYGWDAKPIQVYQMGVCLTEDMHKLFHKTYGLRNFTPENFYEFYSTMKKEVN